ncbi:MAG: LuxR C-terminal-related transcriptional regulator [Candidatus Sericytochromatia bacterium]
MQTLLKPIRVCVADPQPIMRSALKACLRTTEGIHVTELLGSWSELAQHLQSHATDVVVVDQSLLNLTELPQLQGQSQAAWLVLTHHQAEADSLRASGLFQALLNKDAGVTELTRTVQNLVPPANLGKGGSLTLAPPKPGRKAGPRVSAKTPAKTPAKAVAKPAAKNSATALTAREQEVATFQAQGLPLEAMAEKMGVKLNTVKAYLAKINKKKQA